MQMCEWNTTGVNFRVASHFTLHPDLYKTHQIKQWFERSVGIKFTYSIITYLLVPDTSLSSGVEDELLIAILAGADGIVLSQAEGTSIREIHKRNI